MEQVEVITVKVPSELKKQMKQIDVNWSQYIRECVQKKINEQKMKSSLKSLTKFENVPNHVTNEEIVILD